MQAGLWARHGFKGFANANSPTSAILQWTQTQCILAVIIFLINGVMIQDLAQVLSDQL